MPSVLEPLSRRRARRAFATQPVSAELQQFLWQAVALAPSHGNSQPTRILVAETAATRERLVHALSEGNRHWAPAAPLLFALVSIPEHDAVQPNSDGTTRELWAFHAGIAMGNLLAQATALDLIAHPMAGFDEPAVRAAFGAPETVRVLAVVAAGHPGTIESLSEDLQRAEVRQQDRLPIGNVVGYDRWHDAMTFSARELRKRAGA